VKRKGRGKKKGGSPPGVTTRFDPSSSFTSPRRKGEKVLRGEGKGPRPNRGKEKSPRRWGERKPFSSSPPFLITPFPWSSPEDEEKESIRGRKEKGKIVVHVRPFSFSFLFSYRGTREGKEKGGLLHERKGRKEGDHARTFLL